MTENIKPYVVMGGAGYTPWVHAERCVGQTYLHASDARFRVLMAGRQSGKSLCAIAEICTDAMDHGGHINWWIVPNLEVKPRAWRGLLDFLPKEAIRKTNETERRIVLVNGSEIFVKSAAGEALVSESLDFVVCDEVQLWKEEAWSRGISAMLVARPESRVILVGTPRSRNFFYRIWLLGWGKDKCAACQKDPTACSSHHPDYESFRWKTEDSPYTDPSYLAERKRNMPADLYAEEYEADPLDSSGGVFKRVRDRVSTAPFRSDEFTVLGVDVGRAVDFTAIIPMNSARQALYCRRTQDDWPVQQALVVSESIANNFARVLADSASTEGDVFISNLRGAGLAVQAVPTTSASIKRSVIETLRMAFEQGTLQIPNDPVLIDELEAYTYEVNEKTGNISYFGPQGHHDDTVIALALAYWGQRHTTAALAAPKKEQPYIRSRDGLRHERQRRYVA